MKTNTKVEVKNIKQYTTTDGKTFVGKGAKERAGDHQKIIDTKAKIKAVRKRLTTYLEEILELGPEPEENGYEDERGFYEAEDKYRYEFTEIIADMGIPGDEYDDVGDIAELLSNLFYHLGRDNWMGIAKVLED